MGSVFARGKRLYVNYKQVSGRWMQRRTDFVVGQEEDAKAFLEDLERTIDAAIDLGEREEGPLTVERYARRWIDLRKHRVEMWRSDETRLDMHILPIEIDPVTGQTFGQLPLADVRPRHIAIVMEAARTRACARKAGTLAPRTQGHIYKTMHSLFKHAVTPDEYLKSNPCVLPKDLRPSRRDKDPSAARTDLITGTRPE
jgi:hypothetical protein